MNYFRIYSSCLHSNIKLMALILQYFLISPACLSVWICNAKLSLSKLMSSSTMSIKLAVTWSNEMSSFKEIQKGFGGMGRLTKNKTGICVICIKLPHYLIPLSSCKSVQRPGRRPHQWVKRLGLRPENCNVLNHKVLQFNLKAGVKIVTTQHFRLFFDVTGIGLM